VHLKNKYYYFYPAKIFRKSVANVRIGRRGTRRGPR
jgi:hypothetical protein